MPAAESTAVSHAPDSPNAAIDALVRRAQDGDKLAFEQLYKLHISRLLSLTTRLVGGDVATGEELAQRAFVKAWRSLSGFKRASAFSTWLHRIAVRVVCDDTRSAWRQRRVDTLTEAGQHSDPSDSMDLERAIATLPARARQVFVLHDVEGWRHSDIAQTLSISAGTSKSQLSRARSLLRKELNR